MRPEHEALKQAIAPAPKGVWIEFSIGTGSPAHKAWENARDTYGIPWSVPILDRMARLIGIDPIDYELPKCELFPPQGMEMPAPWSAFGEVIEFDRKRESITWRMKTPSAGSYGIYRGGK